MFCSESKDYSTHNNIIVDTIVIFEKHVITEDMSNLLPDISYFLQK